jgi:hypothetical protein
MVVGFTTTYAISAYHHTAKKTIIIKKCHPIFCYKAAVCSISILLSTGMSE